MKGAKAAWEIPDTLPPGQWSSKRRLAAAVRRLNRLCLATDTPEPVLNAFCDDVEGIVAQLEAQPAHTSQDAFRSGRYFQNPAPYADRGVLVGWSNPLSPPMKMEWTAPTAVGTVCFDHCHAGIPGMLHGGIVAACFDQVCGYAVVNEGMGAITTELEVRYVRPTPVGQVLRFEAHKVSADDKGMELKGRCLVDGEVTSVCRARFTRVSPEKMLQMIGVKGFGPQGDP